MSDRGKTSWGPGKKSLVLTGSGSGSPFMARRGESGRSLCRSVTAATRPAFHAVDLALAPHTRETFEKRLNDPSGAIVRNARAMLKEYDEGHPIRTLSYPVPALGFGRDLSLVALGGEPVVDYALRARRE